MGKLNSEILDTLDADPIDLESCFSNHYIVPDYQRDYVWTEKQVSQMLLDLKESYEHKKKPYFMGMMVVFKGPDGALEIIDGQQRITTFFMMLRAIEKRASEAGIKSDDYANYSKLLSTVETDDESGKAVKVLGLKLQFEEADTCLRNIIEDTLPNEDEIESESQTNKNLYKNYKCILESFKKEYTDIDKLLPFGAFLLHKVILVQLVAKDISGALKIFETLNQRGVGLNPLDLLKNIIFMQVPREEFSSLNAKWKEIIDKLNDMEEPPLRFVRYFLTSTYSVVDKADEINGILPEDKIYEWIMKHDDQCHYTTAPFEFVDTMKTRLDKYERFYNPDPTDVGYNYLINIKKLGGSTYRYHLLLLLAASNMNDDLLLKFTKLLESLLYYYVINKIDANNLEPLVAEWCPLVRQIDNDEKYNSFISNHIAKTIKDWKKNNHDNFMLIGLNNLQKYRIRFILARVTRFINKEWEKADDNADVSDFFATDNKIDIEHILPDTIDESRYSEYGLEDGEDYEKYKEMLGNLTLLEKTINTSIHNYSYKDKVEPYQTSKFIITRYTGKYDCPTSKAGQDRVKKWVKSYSEWNKTNISDRQQMLYDICEHIWSIDFNT